jgi:hypothetical protein
MEFLQVENWPAWVYIPAGVLFPVLMFWIVNNLIFHGTLFRAKLSLVIYEHKVFVFAPLGWGWNYVPGGKHWQGYDYLFPMLGLWWPRETRTFRVKNHSDVPLELTSGDEVLALLKPRERRKIRITRRERAVFDIKTIN